MRWVLRTGDDVRNIYRHTLRGVLYLNQVRVCLFFILGSGGRVTRVRVSRASFWTKCVVLKKKFATTAPLARQWGVGCAADRTCHKRCSWCRLLCAGVLPAGGGLRPRKYGDHVIVYLVVIP